MLGRPASGSLAARSDLKNRLSIFRKKAESVSRVEEEEDVAHRVPQVSLADPHEEEENNDVRLSSHSSASGGAEAGWILKQSLDLHFKKERSFLEEAPPFDPPLAEYIKEVFVQLDYHKSGCVCREDFEILCRILDISSSPPASYRNSGIEWLSSYRTHSPVSPLKADKMSDIKYNRSEAERPPSVVQNPNFLFTFGPRPFWELWPQKKRRKRRLNFEEFTRSLLEQWAKSRGISLSKVNHCFPPITLPPKRKRGRSKYLRLLPEDPPGATEQVQRQPSSLEDIRSKRLTRRANRISRRCHFLKRLSRQLDCCLKSSSSPEQSTVVRRGVSNPLLPLPTQVEFLEKQVCQQKGEIRSLRDAIQEMRSSLRLSDAQNLALQVLLRKMKDLSLEGSLENAAASPGSSEVKPSFASRSVAESEKQLENLVHELREMSQTKYPSVGSSSVHQASYSSNNSTLYNNSAKLDDSPFEEEIAATSAALGGAKEDLILTQKELQQTILKLQVKEIELEENSMNLTDAYKALERAQDELNKLREDLDEAQTSLDLTKQELCQTNEELIHTKRTLARTDSALKDTEKRLSQLSQNRLSLVLELNTTREILASSLNKVQDLELKTQKVPYLEARIRELEDSKGGKKYSESSEKSLKAAQPHLLRPLSTIDSGLYSTSSSDSDDESKSVKEVPLDPVSEDEVLRVPPSSSQHPEGRRPPKPPRQPLENPEGTKVSSSNLLYCFGKGAPSSSGKGLDDKVFFRLRKEIQDLKSKFSESQEKWEKERSNLLENKLLIHFEDPAFQVLEAERIRLSLLEEKIKEVLSMLRTLNSMNISPSSLGRLVLEAVEHSISPTDGEVQVFKFLNHLYHGTRDYERVSGENMIQMALDAIEKESQRQEEE